MQTLIQVILPILLFTAANCQATFIVEEPGEEPVVLNQFVLDQLVDDDYNPGGGKDIEMTHFDPVGVLVPIEEVKENKNSMLRDSAVKRLINDALEHDEDYKANEGSIIALEEIYEDAPKTSFMWRTAKSTSKGFVKGVKYLSIQAVRLACGAASAYYLSPIANFYLATGAEVLLATYGASPIVTKMVYIFAVTTVYPYTVALIYYTGTKAPEIVYYTAKGGKAVVMGTVSLKDKVKDAAKYTAEAITRSWKNKKYRIETTKMLEYNPSTVGPSITTGLVAN